jgi:hypothetical protein
MRVKEINFVQDFTDCPGGRLAIHGDFSGEEFREKFLKPALNDADRVVVNLNGASGFPSSFVDEAFGILCSQIGYERVRTKLHIELTDDPVALKEILDCMEAHRA